MRMLPHLHGDISVERVLLGSYRPDLKDFSLHKCLILMSYYVISWHRQWDPVPTALVRFSNRQLLYVSKRYFPIFLRISSHITFAQKWPSFDNTKKREDFFFVSCCCCFCLFVVVCFVCFFVFFFWLDSLLLWQQTKVSDFHFSQLCIRVQSFTFLKMHRSTTFFS